MNRSLPNNRHVPALCPHSPQAGTCKGHGLCNPVCLVHAFSPLFLCTSFPSRSSGFWFISLHLRTESSPLLPLPKVGNRNENERKRLLLTLRLLWPLAPLESEWWDEEKTGKRRMGHRNVCHETCGWKTEEPKIKHTFHRCNTASCCAHIWRIYVMHCAKGNERTSF